MTGRRGWRGAADDTGASLVLALVLLTVLGLVVGGLLTYSANSLRTAATGSGRAAGVYSVDGALQTAVNQVRTSAYNNDPGQPCADLDYPRGEGGTVRVTCTAAGGSGGSSQKVAVAGNRPGQAILTLGGTDEVGIQQGGAATLRVQGKVATRGPINTGTAALRSVNDTVVAGGTCTGSVQGSDAAGNPVAATCSVPAASLPTDPNYAQPTSGLTYRPLPVCDTSGTVEFSPGYYDDAVGLTQMMSGAGACAGKVFHFRPGPSTGAAGIYYFDFRNGEGGGLPTGSHLWTVNDANAVVVGGTPRGWTPDVSRPAALPGSCVSPLDSTTNGGVRFVFGGDSQLRVLAGKAELCGQYSATEPPIALQGAKTGTDTSRTGYTTTDATASTPSGAFVNPQNIPVLDGVASSATVDARGSTTDVTAAIEIGGFDALTAVPAGSILTEARIVVVHRDNNDTSPLRSLRVAVAPTRTGTFFAPATQPTVYQDGPTGTTYHQDSLNVLPNLAKEVHDHGLGRLRVRYEATAAAGSRVIENLDHVRLVVTFRAPVVRGQETPTAAGAVNCVGARGTAGCQFLRTETTGTLVLQGTLYTPLAAVDFRISNAAAPFVRWGLVTRTLYVDLGPSVPFTGPLVTIPSTSAGPVPLEVFFRAFVDGRVAGTARVRYPATDPTATPTPGARAVQVVSYTVRRR